MVVLAHKLTCKCFWEHIDHSTLLNLTTGWMDGWNYHRYILKKNKKKTKKQKKQTCLFSSRVGWPVKFTRYFLTQSRGSIDFKAGSFEIHRKTILSKCIVWTKGPVNPEMTVKFKSNLYVGPVCFLIFDTEHYYGLGLGCIHPQGPFFFKIIP